MDNNLKLEYKVGAIEFKAEGPADAVEQQRVDFMNAVLPAAVEAMARTQAEAEQTHYIESTVKMPTLEASAEPKLVADVALSEMNFSRTSLPAFLKQFGALTHEDFTLFAAYFDETKNGAKCFCIDDVKRYFSEARRVPPKNPSMLLFRLAEKGYIMDTQAPEGAKSGKYYMLTDAGMTYTKDYVPKEISGGKRAHAKARKTTAKAASAYLSITADDLNLGNYPAVKSLSKAKEQVIMAMYIVTNESKGEWFTVEDVIHLLVNVFEVPADADKVNGVFKRNKGIFASQKDENNKRALRHKLLVGAKNFANELVEKYTKS